jgi:hypothetical protein
MHLLRCYIKNINELNNSIARRQPDFKMGKDLNRHVSKKDIQMANKYMGKSARHC